MKKLVLLMFLIPFSLAAQKAVKPSLPKAEKALREGKYAEAKEIIDVTVTSEKFLNSPKAWYLRGIIYTAIDTTKNQEAKSLIADPYPVAAESFDKAKALDNGKGSLFVNDANGLPLLPEQINPYFAQSYFNKAITAYQEEKDYKKSLSFMEKTLYFIPQDTGVLLNAGLFFAPAADEHNKAIEYLRKYVSLGGTSTDAYVMMFGIYRDDLKDYEKALALAKEAMAKHPNFSDFPKFELDMYIKMDRLPEAKAAMEKQVVNDPSDKETKYFLGVINQQTNDLVAARKWYEEAIKLDPQYFEPRIALAELVYLDAKKVRVEMSNLGITAEDKKKRFELDKKLVENLKIALPYWIAAEKISPDDEKVLDNLLSIYSDLDMQPEIARIEKKMKALGLLD